MEFETINGLYTIDKPTGELGVKNFIIMSKAVPTSKGIEDGEGNIIISEGDQERATNAFIEWSSKILPNILISGPCTYDKMTGSDQLAAFMACGEDMEGDAGEELYKIVG